MQGISAHLFAQSFHVADEIQTVAGPIPEIPIYEYSPDGHLTVWPENSGWRMFWPGADSYSSQGASIFEMRKSQKVLARGGPGDFDNGGAWLYAVFPRGGGQMVGFYHAEDHNFSSDPSSTFIAYKSIARCVSQNAGQDWKKEGQILTSHEEKPDQPAWSGLGDHCVVWDEKGKRLICYYQEEGILRMASSPDPEGRAGTWKKWFEGGFSEPGLGGRSTPIVNLDQFPGGNPSVHWNTFLLRWVMVYHTWPGSIVLSQSDDLISWSLPESVIEPEAGSKVWYPTIVGSSDSVAGEKALLLYAYFPDIEKHERVFCSREITFLK